MAKSWFAYTGLGSVILPENYLLSNDLPACRDGFVICAIYAEGQEMHPIDPLSENMIQYITLGLESELFQPFDPYYTKKYVYLKDI